MIRWLMFALAGLVGCGGQSASHEAPRAGASALSSTDSSHAETSSASADVTELPFKEESTLPLLVSTDGDASDEAMRAVLPWHRILSEPLTQAGGSKGRATEAMRCLAAELARSISQHNKLPAPSIQRYFELECGTRGVGTEIQFEMAEVSEPVPGPEALWKAWSSVLTPLIEGSVQSSTKATHLGVSVYVEAPRAVAVVVSQSVPLEFKVVPTKEGSRTGFSVIGKFHTMVEGAAALATDGALGFQACERDPALTLPSFSFQCWSAPVKGRPITVEIFSRQPGRLIANLGARFQVGRSEGTIQRRLDLSQLEITDQSSGAPRWLSHLNLLRSQAGLRTMTFEPEQSRVMLKAMPSYLEELSSPTMAESAERKALAMLAGWHTSVPVVAGSMTTKLVESLDPSEWLGVVLSEPSARMVLMNPDASRVAASFIELSGEEGQGLSGTVVSFETLDLAYRDRSIASLRKGWDLSPQNPTTLIDQRSSLLGEAESGRLSRGDLIEALLNAFSSAQKCEVRVTVVETTDLKALPKPLWLNKVSGQVMVDIAYLGRSASEVRKLWVVLVGVPTDC